MIVLIATLLAIPNRLACIGRDIVRYPVVLSVCGAVHGSIPVSGIANDTLVLSHTFVRDPDHTT